MARRARSHIFDEPAPKPHRLSLAAIPSAAVRGLHAVRRLLTPRLMALSGLALFGWSLIVAFRVINLDAARQLQQPALDFAICGGLGLLGLSISWIHLGEGRTTQESSAENDKRPRLLVSRSNGSTAPYPTTARPLSFRRPLVPPADLRPLKPPRRHN